MRSETGLHRWSCGVSVVSPRGHNPEPRVQPLLIWARCWETHISHQPLSTPSPAFFSCAAVRPSPVTHVRASGEIADVLLSPCLGPLPLFTSLRERAFICVAQQHAHSSHFHPWCSPSTSFFIFSSYLLLSSSLPPPASNHFPLHLFHSLPPFEPPTPHPCPGWAQQQWTGVVSFWFGCVRINAVSSAVKTTATARCQSVWGCSCHLHTCTHKHPDLHRVKITQKRTHRA